MQLIFGAVFSLNAGNCPILFQSFSGRCNLHFLIYALRHWRDDYYSQELRSSVAKRFTWLKARDLYRHTHLDILALPIPLPYDEHLFPFCLFFFLFIFISFLFLRLNWSGEFGVFFLWHSTQDWCTAGLSYTPHTFSSSVFFLVVELGLVVLHFFVVSQSEKKSGRAYEPRWGKWA